MRKLIAGMLVMGSLAGATWAETLPEEAGNTLPAGTAPRALASEEGTLSDLVSLETMLLSDEVLVLTASRHLQRLSEVPGSVTIISAREIQEKGALNLRELLLNLTGAEFAADGTFETMRLRGIESSLNNKVLVLIDGRKINVVDWGSFENFFGHNLDNIKQIEIIKGPGSAMYGANAFAGVINILTRTGGEIDSVNFKASVGKKPSDGQLSQYGLFTYGRALKEIEYRVQASYWRQFGVDPINRGSPDELYDGAKFELAMQHQDEWSLNAGFHKMDVAYPGFYDYPTPHGRNYQSQFFVDARHKFTLDEISSLNLRLEDSFYPLRTVNRTTYNIKRVKIGSPADLPPGVAVIIDDSGVTRPAIDAVGGQYISILYLQGLMNGTAERDQVTSGAMNELLFEAQYDLTWPDQNYLVAGANLTHDWSGQDYFTSASVQDLNLAAYLQDEYRPLEELIALAGVRFDHNSGYGATLSPRGSLIYTPLPDLRAKVLYSSAFRAPAFMERYSESDYGLLDIMGNPDLKPEQIQQTEGRIEYELGKWLKASGAYFYWETKDEIQFRVEKDDLFIYSPDLSYIDPSFPSTPGFFYTPELNTSPTLISWTNANSRLAHGLELEGQARPWPFLVLSANYARFQQHSRNDPAILSWESGVVELYNAMVGWTWENRIFARVYGHVGHSPLRTADSKRVLTPWQVQYDVSCGGNWRNFNAVFTVFNVLKSANFYDLKKDDYFHGPQTFRLTVDYTAPF